ncbi:hypothetical protein [Janthinobacterium tructae]
MIVALTSTSRPAFHSSVCGVVDVSQLPGWKTVWASSAASG